MRALDESARILVPSSPEVLPTTELIKETFSNALLLAQRQLKLAQLEAMAQLKQEKTVLELLSTAGALAHAGVVLLLVAIALVIGEALGGRFWAGLLIIGGALILVALGLGLAGWAKRVRRVLPLTRGEISKEIAWAQTRLS